MKKVSPSLLACDFLHLSDEIKKVQMAGADWLHLDVMDGVFVPNISFGLPLVSAAKKVATCPLDVHLMIVKPEKYIQAFVKAGADIVTIHVESTNQVSQVVSEIKALGAKAGLSLRPSTPIQAIEPYLDQIDLVLVMTVEPGFGGQSFRQDQVEKIDWLYNQKTQRQLDLLIEVDGGINDQTVLMCKNADIFVAGTYIFKSDNPKLAMDKLRLI